MSKMLTRIWKQISSFFSGVKYYLCRPIVSIKPFPLKNRLSNYEGLDDIECCRDPCIEGQTLSAADDEREFSIKGDKGVVINPVPYEPLLGEVLAEGSTSRIARMAPGVVIKYPRFSWWHSKEPADKWFVQDMKRSFHVEESLLQILGQHPRIIEYANPLSLMSGR